jgi:hypothetical protein
MSTTRGRSADLTHSAAVRQLNKSVNDRAAIARATAYSALEARGRSTNVPRGPNTSDQLLEELHRSIQEKQV